MPTLSLIGRLGLDKTGFDAGLAGANKSIARFGSGLKSQLAGAFGAAAVISFTRNIINAAGELKDISTRLKVDVEELQRFQFAAEQTGASVNGITTAFKRLSEARLEALRDPSSKAGQVFSAIGIGRGNLESESLEKIFRRVSAAIKSNDYGASELAMVNELFGRSGGELIPMMIEGVDELGKGFRVMGKASVEVLDELGDESSRLWKTFKSLSGSAIAGSAWSIKNWANAIIRLNNSVAAGIWRGGQSLVGGGGSSDGPPSSGMRLPIPKEILNPPSGRTPKAFEFEPSEKNKSFSIQGDSLSRIGAFTGESAARQLRDLAMEQVEQLKELRSELSRRGILIRDKR